MIRAIRLQAQEKICPLSYAEDSPPCDFKAIKKSATRDFFVLIRRRDEEKFLSLWDAYKVKFAAHIHWMEYLDTQWMSKRENWWLINRDVSPAPFAHLKPLTN